MRSRRAESRRVPHSGLRAARGGVLIVEAAPRWPPAERRGAAGLWWRRCAVVRGHEIQPRGHQEPSAACAPAAPAAPAESGGGLFGTAGPGGPCRSEASERKAERWGDADRGVMLCGGVKAHVPRRGRCGGGGGEGSTIYIYMCSSWGRVGPREAADGSPERPGTHGAHRALRRRGPTGRGGGDNSGPAIWRPGGERQAIWGLAIRRSGSGPLGAAR